MALTSRVLGDFIGIFTWLFLTNSFSYGTQSDINCLRSIKESLEDPLNNLKSSWNFNNNTEGFICEFNGVMCWHADENRVLNIRLSDMGLKGKFPRGVADCKSLTGLDLSSNDLYGTIPSDISYILQFVTSLDLSSNNLSGEIPLNLANCSYLNVLKLDKNQLTDSYSGLCGKPLSPCRGFANKKKFWSHCGRSCWWGVIVAAFLVGFIMLFFLRRVSRKKKERR